MREQTRVWTLLPRCHHLARGPFARPVASSTTPVLTRTCPLVAPVSHMTLPAQAGRSMGAGGEK